MRDEHSEYPTTYLKYVNEDGKKILHQLWVIIDKRVPEKIGEIGGISHEKKEWRAVEYEESVAPTGAIERE